MSFSPSRAAVALVVVIAIAGAAFRVVTAPDRIKQTRDTARSVCLAGGGQWRRVDGNEVCVKPR